MGINISNVGVPLDDKYTQLAIKKGIEYSVPPSFFICQWWYESRFGSTQVAKNNNNWGGTSWFYNSSSYKRKSGVTAYRGTKRPAKEGAYYMKFLSVDDYMIDYFYLLLEQGMYNVKNSSSFDIAVKGLFRVGGARSDYAGTGYNNYLRTMQGVRIGINNRNDNILDKIDKEPEKYYDGSVKPVEPKPPVEVPPDDKESESSGIDFYTNFSEFVFGKINKFLTSDLFNMDIKGSTFGNSHLKLIKQYDNMYKIEPTLNFENTFKQFFKEGYDEFENITQGEIGRPQEPVEDDNIPKPSAQRYFPVRYSNAGINFWKKSNWKPGTLQYQMCYGWTRDKGTRHHAGYDIGAGGNKGYGVYATTDSIVQYVKNTSSSGGFMIQLKHTTDEYYSTYLHLVTNSNLVNVGDKVKAGQKIATMGNTPENMGMSIHLHFTLSRDGSITGEKHTFDPEEYLKITGDNKTELPSP